MNLQEITALRDRYIAGLREYSQAQRALWQQVPWMALQADGRSGWCEDRSRAYHKGVWTINAIVVSSFYVAFVDLETGELVCKKGQPLRDDLVLRISLDDIDASRIIGDLQQSIMRPLTAYTPEGNLANERRREEIIRWTGLSEGVPYKRKQRAA